MSRSGIGPNLLVLGLRTEALGATSEIGEGCDEQADMFEGDWGSDALGDGICGDGDDTSPLIWCVVEKYPLRQVSYWSFRAQDRAHVDIFWESRTRHECQRTLSRYPPDVQLTVCNWKENF
jgi:hypothetical protein